MWFGVLGPLEVRGVDGGPIAVSGPLRRRVLAALLCRQGAVVSAATLIDDLWGAAPPRTASVTLRSHIVRLRDDLRRAGVADVLATEAAGYRLNVSDCDVDALRFELLADQAAQLGDPTAAIERYDDALELWRGEAYSEFGDAAFAVVERVRLSELRALARERRTDLALSAGMSAELVSELEVRVRAEPYRERGWAQLALALYRAGRQAEALATCRRARNVLVADLGVDPGPELRVLEDRLLRHDPSLLLSRPPAPAIEPTLDRCPYLGLAGYQERDAALFVGRERLTSVVAGTLADQPVVVVLGASGVGKSSLVRAGLVPALRSGALPGSAAWRIDVSTPRTSLVAGLDAAHRPDLVILDQAEELFTVLDAAERTKLLERLVRYVDDDCGRLIVVLRSDFFGRLAEIDSLAPFAQKSAVLVGPLRADQVRRVLVEPAAAAGLQLDDDLVEAIMEDVAGQPAPLPLLSEAMVRTWQRRDGTELTLGAYRRAGELSGALEAAAEECFTRLAEPERRAARHLLVRMATSTANGWVRRPIARRDLASDAQREALTALVAARLVVVADDRIELTHDALLVHWPRLRVWLDERSLAAELLQHLEQAADAWRSSGRQDVDLYRGPRLSAATDWRVEHPEDLSPGEVEFLDASARAADADLEFARAQAARERRGRRRLRVVVVALALSLVAAAGAVVAVVHEQRVAQRAALAADARRLAALAANAPDIATSSLLAATAYELQDSPETRGALLTAVERNQSALWRIGSAHRLLRVVATPDGRRLVASDNRGELLVYDPVTRRRVARFPAGSDFLDGITADGREVVVFGPEGGSSSVGQLSVFDVASGTPARTLMTGGDLNGPEPVTSTDGRWVVAVTGKRRGPDAVVDVFDSRDWTAPPRQFLTTGIPLRLAAGRTALAVEHADASVEVRTLPSLKTIGELPAPARAPDQLEATIAVAADGSQVARADPVDPRRVVVYRVGRHSAASTPLPTQPQGVSTMVFSPDGAELSVGSFSGSLAVYRSTDGAQVASFAGHAGPVLGTAWVGARTPQGLYTVGLDSELVSWDLTRDPRLITESGPDLDGPNGSGALFGSRVVGLTGTPDEPRSEWLLYSADLRRGDVTTWPARLRDDDGIDQLVASANGRRAVLSLTNTAGYNRTVVWDLRTHEVIGHLQLPPGTARFPSGLAAAISPDGRYAYSSIGFDRIGVFALPSGRYVRGFTVRFADTNPAQMQVLPWQFDPAGDLVVKGYDLSSAPSPNQRLGLVNVSTGRLIAQVGLGDIGDTSTVAWSHDGRFLAVGTYDGTLTLRDAATLKPLVDAGPVEPGSLTSASFAPDDKTLVTAGTSGALNFWSVPDLSREGGRVIIGNGANNGGVLAWFDAAGNVVGLASDERKPNTDLQRWFTFNAQPASLLSTACGLAGADITRVEWARYVGDRPYRPVCLGHR